MDHLAGGLPDWLVRTDLGNYSARRLEEAGYCTSDYGSAEDAIRNYLAELSGRSEAVWWDRDEDCFRIEQELHAGIFRVADVRRRLRKILQAARINDIDGLIERWIRRYNVNGRCPRAVLHEGGADADNLLERITKLGRMSDSHWGSHVVDDLCGLPLKGLREQRLLDRTVSEKAKTKAIADAVEARRRSIRLQAASMLASDGDSWLITPAPEGDAFTEEWAAASDLNLGRAEHMLFEAQRARDADIRNEADIARRLQALRNRAEQAFRDVDRAVLFLRTTQPRLGGQRPQEACVTEAGYRAALALLSAKR